MRCVKSWPPTREAISLCRQIYYKAVNMSVASLQSYCFLESVILIFSPLPKRFLETAIITNDFIRLWLIGSLLRFISLVKEVMSLNQ